MKWTARYKKITDSAHVHLLGAGYLEKAPAFRTIWLSWDVATRAPTANSPCVIRTMKRLQGSWSEKLSWLATEGSHCEKVKSSLWNPQKQIWSIAACVILRAWRMKSFDRSAFELFSISSPLADDISLSKKLLVRSMLFFLNLSSCFFLFLRGCKPRRTRAPA